MKIQFTPNPQKIIEAITWVAKKLPGSDRYTILKTLFYADKYHLQSYGRPVTGDTYIKMPAGPVASMAYDILKAHSFLPREILIAADAAFEFRPGVKYPPIDAKRSPNMDCFSGTDIECLDKAATFCREKGFQTLKESTHQEPAWLAATLNGAMDFSLFIDEDIPHRQELLEYIAETSSCQMA